MKKTCILGLLLASIPILAQNAPMDLATIRGFNYTPASVQAHEDLWLHYDPQEVQRDFRYAQSLRLNQARVFVIYDAYKKDPKTFAQSLSSFMDAAQDHQIGVMLVFGVRPNAVNGLAQESEESADAKLMAWARDLVSIVKDKQSMRFWDVANEPDWPGYREARRPAKEIEHQMHLAKMFADTIHATDSKHAVTVGCFALSCMEELAGYTDVLTFHDYSPTVEQIDANIERAKAIAEKVHKPVMDTEMGCIGRANPYDVMLREYKKAGMGFYIWELMITHFWGNVHGVFYPDGTVRDPSIPAAILGFFRNQGPDVVLEDADREGWVTSSVADGQKWLDAPNPDWREGLKIAEIQANLLEGGQLVALHHSPTRTVSLLHSGPEDIPALRNTIREFVNELQPYVDPHPLHVH